MPRHTHRDTLQFLKICEVAERVKSSVVYQLVDAGRVACHRIRTVRGIEGSGFEYRNAFVWIKWQMGSGDHGDQHTRAVKALSRREPYRQTIAPHRTTHRSFCVSCKNVLVSSPDGIFRRLFSSGGLFHRCTGRREIHRLQAVAMVLARSRWRAPVLI